MVSVKDMTKFDHPWYQVFMHDGVMSISQNYRDGSKPEIFVQLSSPQLIQVDNCSGFVFQDTEEAEAFALSLLAVIKEMRENGVC